VGTVSFLALCFVHCQYLQQGDGTGVIALLDYEDDAVLPKRNNVPKFTLKEVQKCGLTIHDFIESVFNHYNTLFAKL
jgi:hypothetical protein